MIIACRNRKNKTHTQKINEKETGEMEDYATT
jgi:hypothetical protein